MFFIQLEAILIYYWLKHFFKFFPFQFIRYFIGRHPYSFN